MSHKQQMSFVKYIKDIYPKYFLNSKVLEIGSLYINGTIRIFFENCDYTGVDVGPGKMVDVICEGQNLKYEDNTYDTTASCECFEHNPYWKETFENMYRMTKKNGLLFFTCATTGRPEHGTKRTSPENAPLLTWDYYKNLTEEDFTKNIDISNMFSEYKFMIDLSCNDLYFYGIKK